MKTSKITFVTGNKAKAKEVSRILNIPLEILETEIEEIQEINLEKVALNKLNQAFGIVKGPVIIDDISLEISAWNGFPGPLIKWMLKSENDTANLLLRLLKNEENRKAIAKLAIGYHDGKNPYLFIGEIDGEISKEIRGENGFGWDPVFVPDGERKTFAEMTPSEKDKISHRKIALKKLSDFLNEAKVV
jgi:non-canonical purine NTP pyrophosphatase (RdgB/HAM1 family)